MGIKVTAVDPKDVLAVTMQPNDADAVTVRDYLAKLLWVVWDENEDFSGKRPFGNSGWCMELFEALLRAGMVSGSFDEDGYVSSVDDRRADRLIRLAIEELGKAST